MISVVACVKNRAENVRKWIASISGQTCSEILEIVLVDFSSTDNLKEVLDSAPRQVNLVSVGVQKEPTGFPEAFLKNVGIRRSRGDIVICTNVDVVYEPTFFWNIASRCAPGVLVQAVRKNVPEGVAANTNGTMEPPASNYSLVNDFMPETGIPLVAGADCQAMTKQFWEMFRGYDEELFGWGALDSDLTCRALLWGMTLNIVGHSIACYLHDFHPSDVKKQFLDANRNHPIIMGKINCGTICRNPRSWGGIVDGVEIPALTSKREAQNG